MYPIITQAVNAQRINDWLDQAAQHRLVSQARRARHGTTLPAATRPETTRPAVTRPAAARPVASEPSVRDDRQPVGGRAA